MEGLYYLKRIPESLWIFPEKTLVCELTKQRYATSLLNKLLPIIYNVKDSSWFWVILSHNKIKFIN